MVINIKQTDTQATNLYNNILLLSGSKLFYTKFNLIDTFQNRIHLIFIHISFIFIKIKQNGKNKVYKIFQQKIFDLIFKKIELNMREIGYGDVSVNKNMKFLVKTFYNILLSCEKYNENDISNNHIFLIKYLTQKNNKNSTYNQPLIEYFNKYEAFCFDLTYDSVLKGELNFKY